MSDANIGGIGELLVEFVTSEAGVGHRAGGTYRGPFAAGAPAVFVDQAARLGARAVLVGAVGDDVFGTIATERLQRDGVDTALVKRLAGSTTGVAFVSHGDKGKSDIVGNIATSAAARFSSDEATIATLAGLDLDVFHICGSTLAEPALAAKALKVCDALHGWGVRISFYPRIQRDRLAELEYNKAIHDIMERCAIFLPSEEDASILFPGEDLDTFAPALLARSAECVALWKPGRGVEALTRNAGRASAKSHPVDAVDLSGAGDCARAVFVTLMAGGRFDLGASLARAQAAEALSSLQLGPMEGASSLSEIESFLAARR